MMRFLFSFLFVFWMLVLSAQIGSTYFKNEGIIPLVTFQYSFIKEDFVRHNTTIDYLDKKYLIPELSTGALFVSKNYVVGASWGWFQNTFSLHGGYFIPLKRKK